MSGPDEREDEPVENDYFLAVRYRYNFAGGFLSLGSPDDEITVNLQNQVTLDGTFYDRPNMPTALKGFSVPFLRTYLYGNVTKHWQYQLATQSFLGQFNILDAFVNYHHDDRLNIRVGRGLSPFLYEYFAFSPAWEPVITNSPLFQFAGKRQEGVLFYGDVADHHFQYQAGVFNGVSGAFYDLDKNVDFIGSFTLTPFIHSETIFDHFGFGVGVQTGQHNYALNQTSSSFTNGAGEPTTNINYVASTGVPFFQYDTNTFAAGNQTRVAPHLFWYGRFSLLTEYVHSARRLSLNGQAATTEQSGYFVNASYWLTGERYKGNGLGGYSTIEPLRPFRWGHGPGAWEVASQIAQVNLDANNFNFAAAPNTYASRCVQLMLGVNWWPNKYVRLSLDNVWTSFNRPVPLGPVAGDSFNTAWFRCAMFF